MINDRVLELLAYYLDGGTFTSGRLFLLDRYPFLDHIEIGAISSLAAMEYMNWQIPGRQLLDNSFDA
jgi:hypothetical protein